MQDYKFSINFLDIKEIKPIYIFGYDLNNAKENLDIYLKDCSFKHHNNSYENTKIVGVKEITNHTMIDFQKQPQAKGIV